MASLNSAMLGIGGAIFLFASSVLAVEIKADFSEDYEGKMLFTGNAVMMIGPNEMLEIGSDSLVTTDRQSSFRGGVILSVGKITARAETLTTRTLDDGTLAVYSDSFLVSSQ